jgi:hypothetical protein
MPMSSIRVTEPKPRVVTEDTVQMLSDLGASGETLDHARGLIAPSGINGPGYRDALPNADPHLGDPDPYEVNPNGWPLKAAVTALAGIIALAVLALVMGFPK